MELEVNFSADSVREAFERTILAALSVPAVELERLAGRSLKEAANETRLALGGFILDEHPLRDIVLNALRDVETHANAVDTLFESKAFLPHVRHIDEVATAVQFVCLDPARYNEFNWRWKNFEAIHAIRNRLINLDLPLDAPHEAWLDANFETLKLYATSTKKLVRDPTLCKDIWRKLFGNWMFSVFLKDMYAAVGRIDYYEMTEYDWNSQAVHFSPISDQFFTMTTEHNTYVEAAKSSVLRSIHSFYREGSGMVADRERLRKRHAVDIASDLHSMLRNKPNWYMDLANKGGRFDEITSYVLSGGVDTAEVIQLLLGAEPPDPLAIVFASSTESASDATEPTATVTPVSEPAMPR